MSLSVHRCEPRYVLNIAVERDLQKPNHGSFISIFSDRNGLYLHPYQDAGHIDLEYTLSP
jgi:hypothetical protein